MEMKKLSELSEFRLFEAFAKSSSFDGAINELEQSGDDKIIKMISAPKMRKSLNDSFDVFKDTVSDLNLSTSLEDYSSKEVFDRFKETIKENMYPFTPKTSEPVTFFSKGYEKIEIGKMLLQYAEFINSGGKEIIKEYNKQQKKIINELRHEQARTFKYGCIGHGSYSEHSVFSTESGKYKPYAKKVKKDDFEK